jgi:hypothetical protein
VTTVRAIPARHAIAGMLFLLTSLTPAHALLPPGARHRNEMNAILEDGDLEKLLRSNPIDRIEWQGDHRYLVEWRDLTHDQSRDQTDLCRVSIDIDYEGPTPRVDEGKLVVKIDQPSVTCR